jgi:hypothetical protein
MSWHFRRSVSLLPEPGDDRLEGPIGAAPSVVVKVVLHVVVVRVVALNHSLLTADS